MRDLDRILSPGGQYGYLAVCTGVMLESAGGFARDPKRRDGGDADAGG